MEPITENNTKMQLEAQFQELLDKAQEVYPDIHESLVIYNNIVSDSEIIQNYINLSTVVPNEVTNNKTSA